MSAQIKKIASSVKDIFRPKPLEDDGKTDTFRLQMSDTSADPTSISAYGALNALELIRQMDKAQRRGMGRGEYDGRNDSYHWDTSKRPMALVSISREPREFVNENFTSLVFTHTLAKPPPAVDYQGEYVDTSKREDPQERNVLIDASTLRALEKLPSKDVLDHWVQMAAYSYGSFHQPSRKTDPFHGLPSKTFSGNETRTQTETTWDLLNDGGRFITYNVALKPTWDVNDDEKAEGEAAFDNSTEGGV